MPHRPNQRAAETRPFFARYGAVILVCMAFLFPLVVRGVIGAVGSTSNDPRQWLPRGFDETEKYMWLQSHFGRDEVAVVSWPDCTLANGQAVDRLAEALIAPVPTASGGQVRWFDRAITGPSVLRRLTSPRLELPQAEALARLRGILVGPDGQTTCIVLVISEAGTYDRMAAVKHIHDVAATQCGLTPDDLRLGGPTVDAATIDSESRRLLLHLAGISAVVALIVAWWRLGNFRLAMIVFLGAVYSTFSALALLYYTGGNLNLLMTMLSPLVYVLSISAGVHLINYYRDALEEVGPAEAPGRALVLGWKPCVLASTTTAAGLLSLTVSEIVPIWSFGIYSAAGMVISVTVMLLFLPTVLQRWPHPSLAGTPSGAGSRFLTADPAATVRRFHAPITVVSLTLMVGMGWGLLSIESTVKLQHRFDDQSKIINDYRWLEKNLGPLVPLEVVIRFEGSDNAKPSEFLQRMELVENVRREIARSPDVGATMSASAFAPLTHLDDARPGASARATALPDRYGFQGQTRRFIMGRRLFDGKQGYIDAHFLKDTPEEQLWRISVRADALSHVDYGHFVEALRGRIDPMLRDDEISGVRATYTGVIPLIYKAQRELFNDLVESFFTAFGVIALVMIVVLRSVRAGLMAMAPNLFPAVVVFGAMGWSGVLIEIGSVMTASAALGIAVDDTIHFLTWFRRGIAQGMSRAEALRFSYGHCAKAMVHTTLICGSGLLVFVFSSFMPIVHFAWLMAVLLIAALLGDLIFLPAMLAGPLGRIFQRNASRRLAVQDPTPAETEPPGEIDSQ